MLKIKEFQNNKDRFNNLFNMKGVVHFFQTKYNTYFSRLYMFDKILCRKYFKTNAEGMDEPIIEEEYITLGEMKNRMSFFSIKPKQKSNGKETIWEYLLMNEDDVEEAKNILSGKYD